MTEREIRNMQPGQELDRLVAEAAGIKVHTLLWDFRPSTEWADAMMAAEKSGLFMFKDRPADPKTFRFSAVQSQAFLTKEHDNWAVNLYVNQSSYANGVMHKTSVEQQYVSTLSVEKSGPLAICKAILISQRDLI